MLTLCDSCGKRATAYVPMTGHYCAEHLACDCDSKVRGPEDPEHDYGCAQFNA